MPSPPPRKHGTCSWETRIYPNAGVVRASSKTQRKSRYPAPRRGRFPAINDGRRPGSLSSKFQQEREQVREGGRERDSTSSFAFDLPEQEKGSRDSSSEARLLAKKARTARTDSRDCEMLELGLGMCSEKRRVRSLPNSS